VQGRSPGKGEKAIEFAVKGGRFPAADAALVKNKFLPNAMALRDQGYDVECEIACLSMIAGFGADEGSSPAASPTQISARRKSLSASS
jgi:hypothetical protein